MQSRRPSLVSIAALLSLVFSFLAWPGSSALAVATWSDGFESGSTGGWTSSSGLVVQSTIKIEGSWAARSSGSVAWASKTLPDVTSDVEVSVWFRFESRSTSVWLTRLRTGSNGNLIKVMVNNGGKLVYRNDVAGVTRASTEVVTNGVWHHLQARVTVAGANGHVQILLDGVPVSGLDRVESLGSSPAGRVEVGNRPTGKSFDMLIDDVDVIDLEASDDPQPPTAVTIDDVGLGGVDLSWTPPAAGPTPASYRVYRDNALVGTVSAPATSFSDAGATDVTRYLYTVTSVAGGSASGPSGFAVAESPAFGAGDAVVYAAGDIVCKPGSTVTANACRHGQTADIVDGGAADAVIALGDLQYEVGKPSDYTKAYDPTWGRVKAITLPVVGNHEYMCKTTTQGCSYPAAGYYGYFGVAAGDPDEGWYRDSIAGWTVLSINSNCKPGAGFYVVGCQAGSAQYQWAQAQLATDGACTMAVWHHPRFSSGAEHGSSTWMQDMWALMANGGVDILLVGHEHIYERFAPANAAGAATTTGLQQFTVGTGGKDHAAAGAPLALSRAVADDVYGVLKLTLHPGGYDYDYVPAWGDSFADAGSGVCA